MTEQEMFDEWWKEASKVVRYFHNASFDTFARNGWFKRAEIAKQDRNKVLDKVIKILLNNIDSAEIALEDIEQLKEGE